MILTSCQRLTDEKCCTRARHYYTHWGPDHSRNTNNITIVFLRSSVPLLPFASPSRKQYPLSARSCTQSCIPTPCKSGDYTLPDGAAGYVSILLCPSNSAPSWEDQILHYLTSGYNPPNSVASHPEGEGWTPKGES